MYERMSYLIVFLETTIRLFQCGLVVFLVVLHLHNNRNKCSSVWLCQAVGIILHQVYTGIGLPLLTTVAWLQEKSMKTFSRIELCLYWCLVFSF